MLHVVDGLGISGKTRSLVSIASLVDRRRFSPVVCRLNDEPSALVTELEAADVPLHTIACRDGVSPKAALQVAKLAWSLKADVVHCWNPRPMLYGGWAARAIGIRATVGFLSAFACQMPDRAYDFLPQPLATVSQRHVRRNRLAAAAMRFIVTVSRRLGERFRAYNGLADRKFRVIPYGTDLHATDRIPREEVAQLRRQLGFRPEDLVVGSVGRLVEQKDYPTELRAFALAAGRVPALRLVIAGGGPLRATLEQMARDLGVADRVRFMGHHANVPLLLKSVDVFALTSRFEPFGVALIEAKAAGLPIVATAVNEVADIIADGRTGLLAPAQDPGSLALLFERLALDRDERVRLGARARVESRPHDLRAVVAAHEALYEAALTGQPDVSAARAPRADSRLMRV